MDETYGTYVDDESLYIHGDDDDDDTDDGTDDDTDDDTDDGGRGNLYIIKNLKDQGSRFKAQGSRIKTQGSSF